MAAVKKNRTGRERGIQTPPDRTYLLGNIGERTENCTQNLAAYSHDVAQVVTVCAKLHEPLKAAILAIVKSAEVMP